MKRRTRIIAYLGLLIALDIVLTRFLSIQVPGPSWRIGLGFIPMSMAGFLFGPIWGAVEAGLADIIRALAFPIGPFFWGYTVSSLARGIIYGLFLYKCRFRGWKLWLWCALCVVSVIVIVDIGLNSYWDVLVQGTPFDANVAEKLVLSSPVNAAIRIAVMPLYIGFLQKNYNKILGSPRF